MSRLLQEMHPPPEAWWLMTLNLRIRVYTPAPRLLHTLHPGFCTPCTPASAHPCFPTYFWGF